MQRQFDCVAMNGGNPAINYRGVAKRLARATGTRPACAQSPRSATADAGVATSRRGTSRRAAKAPQ